MQRDLLGVQHLLNSSEASLHQLTALLDCRGLNKVCFFSVWCQSSRIGSAGEKLDWGGRRQTAVHFHKCAPTNVLYNEFPETEPLRLFVNNAGPAGPWQHVGASAS